MNENTRRQWERYTMASRLSGTDRLVLYWLVADHSAGEGFTRPGLRRLEQCTGMQRATLVVSLQRLETAGAIRLHRAGAGRRADEYRIPWLVDQPASGAKSTLQIHTATPLRPVRSGEEIHTATHSRPAASGMEIHTGNRTPSTPLRGVAAPPRAAPLSTVDANAPAEDDFGPPWVAERIRRALDVGVDPAPVDTDLDTAGPAAVELVEVPAPPDDAGAAPPTVDAVEADAEPAAPVAPVELVEAPPPPPPRDDVDVVERPAWQTAVLSVLTRDHGRTA